MNDYYENFPDDRLVSSMDKGVKPSSNPIIQAEITMRLKKSIDAFNKSSTRLSYIMLILSFLMVILAILQIIK